MNESKIYTSEGEILKLENSETLKLEKKYNNYFFRKNSNSIVEIKIYEILKLNYHPNIVSIYGYGKDHVDIEVLDTDLSKTDKVDIKNTMCKVKDFLQNLGIVYIDWKYDQIGIDQKGNIKIFDFDGSGIIDRKTSEWTLIPCSWYSYNKAVTKGITNPIAIDNFSFNDNFK